MREILTEKMLDTIDDRKISLSSVRSIHRLPLVANDVGDAVAAIKTDTKRPCRVVSPQIVLRGNFQLCFSFKMSIVRLHELGEIRKIAFRKILKRHCRQSRRLRTCVKVSDRITFALENDEQEE